VGATVEIEIGALRRKHFHLAEMARKLLDFDAAIADMERTLRELAEVVALEEVRTRVTDVNHCRYSTIAMAATDRSDRLRKSIVNLKAERDRARESFASFQAVE
jgi:elongation factor P--beta-lysine ligase